MSNRKVKFELDVNKLASWSAVIAAVLCAGLWFLSAQSAHNKVTEMPPPPNLHLTEQLVKDLAKGQKTVNKGIQQLQNEETIRQGLWGEDYRDKISSMVAEYDKQNVPAQ